MTSSESVKLGEKKQDALKPSKKNLSHSLSMGQQSLI